MHKTPRNSGEPAGARPRVPVIAELSAIPPEDPRDDLAANALPLERALSLTPEKCLELREAAEREDPALTILGRPRLEPHGLRAKVHLPPGQSLHFAASPSREPGKLDRGREPVRKLIEHAKNLFVGQEPLPYVIEPREWKLRLDRQDASDEPEVEHPTQMCDLMVDCPTGGALLEALGDVTADALVSDRNGRKALELGLQVLQGVLDPVPRSVLLLLIVRADEANEVVEPGLLDAVGSEGPALDLSEPATQQSDRVSFQGRVRGLPVLHAPE